MLLWRMSIRGAPAQCLVSSIAVPAGLGMHLARSVSIGVSGFVTIQRHVGPALTSVGAGNDIDQRVPSCILVVGFLKHRA